MRMNKKDRISLKAHLELLEDLHHRLGMSIKFLRGYLKDE
jgi:hypothetical protein